MIQLIPQPVSSLLQGTRVLVVDDDFYSRKVARTLLMALGITTIYEADSGGRGLEAVRALAPDVVLLDWEMPMMHGGAFAKAVRTPGGFPRPDLPIIMLTSHSERWRVEEAMRLGVNGYLLKPVSGELLRERLIAALTNPRPVLKPGGHHRPEPRPGPSDHRADRAG